MNKELEKIGLLYVIAYVNSRLGKFSPYSTERIIAYAEVCVEKFYKAYKDESLS